MQSQAKKLPRHVAIIMDGNGRWAKSRLMPRGFGHQQGLSRMIELLEYAYDCGVEFVTVYALSTENLNRPKEELEGLFDLIRKRFVDGMRKVCQRGVRLRVIGETWRLPKDVQELVAKAEADTEQFERSGKGLNVAIAYGARSEIARAAREAVKAGEPITEETISAHLYTYGQPDPDLIIRTGKEVRLSNFLLFQGAYAELYFSEKMFPEFTCKDMDAAFEEFALRTRRFGKTDEQL